MDIAVAICSTGRPAAIDVALTQLARQTKQPSDVLLVVTTESDLPELARHRASLPVRVLMSKKGLTRQRNRALEALLPASDILLFIDDDYLASKTALAALENGFYAYPDVTGITGRLLADGIGRGGIAVNDALVLVRSYEAQHPSSAPNIGGRNLVGLYGCNMAFRCDRVDRCRFDERLPLYGWQEDTDFSSRMEGENIRLDSFVGVHCGTFSGRETQGQKLGYSQMANVAYLIKKGSISRRYGMQLMLRNFAANHVKCLSPEPWIDRQGRVLGNWKALRDMMLGCDAPERILRLQVPT